MATPGEVTAMRRALELAGDPSLRPGANPRVGCVVLDTAGEQVGHGAHAGAGTAHAEVLALAAAGPAARGGTAVVTLEPCDHTGRTGPCTRALLAAGVSRVVHAQSDPDPVAAGGAAVLRRAGVQVESGVLADAAEELNADWSAAVRLGRPHVTWKLAATLDGRAAAADGSSRWVTGEVARARVHQLRAEADAVVVGTGTALADDPELTARDAAGAALPRHLQPLRVVVGRRSLPPGARLLDQAAETLRLPDGDPPQVLAALHSRGVRRVLLEGGPTLAGAFCAAGLVDRVEAHLAPALLGAGPAAMGAAGVTSIAGALRLRITDLSRLGQDVRITAVPVTAHQQGRA